VEVLWVHKMCFYANLSCEERGKLFNKFGFVKWRVWSLSWLFLIECLAFCSTFVGRFGLFYWRLGLFWKNKSGNPGSGLPTRHFWNQILNSGFFVYLWLVRNQNLAYFSQKGLAVAKHCLSCIVTLWISSDKSLWPHHAGCTEYSKAFIVALKIFDVIDKK